MKNRVIYSLVALVFVASVPEVVAHVECELLQPTFRCSEFTAPQSSAINVLVMGDSWATHPNLANSLHTELGEPVRSSGHSGETSKAVYMDVFGENGCNDNSNLFAGVTYAVVVVGVNDAQTHRGAEYYSHHLLLFITSLRARHIHPVIMLLPHFGIKDAYRIQPWYMIAKHGYFEFAVDHGKSDIIDQYRAAFQTKVNADGAIFVDPDEAVGRYSSKNRDWINPIHLSPKGDRALGTEIGQAILRSRSGNQ